MQKKQATSRIARCNLLFVCYIILALQLPIIFIMRSCTVKCKKARKRKGGGMVHSDIKLYIVTHKPTYIPQHPLFVPLQIGTALHALIPHMQHDNTGDHISQLNNRYCELTGQYWAWKNDHADYYGFFHYRRYFSFVHEDLPYRIMDYPDDTVLQSIGYDADYMQSFISQYDIIVPRAENMHETAWQNYARAPHHYAEDLQLAVEIVKTLTPQYTQATDTYMNGTRLYLKNMYIMKREYFHGYCAWLFPILAEFDKQNTWDKYHGNTTAMRVNGYLAERLFGIWYTYMTQNNEIKTCELGRIHFANMDAKGKLQYMKWVNRILPPGTKRRNVIATCAKKIIKQS